MNIYGKVFYCFYVRKFVKKFYGMRGGKERERDEIAHILRDIGELPNKIESKLKRLAINLERLKVGSEKF